ncbi:MAG TPA: proprotein convertase P-domain-containing protein [Planctomycetota bacterium]|nr:proprotein convertase P-domain-containing protein [Planctomycetota bacterium]
MRPLSALATILSGALAAAASGQSQTVAFVEDPNPAVGIANVIPFNQIGGYTSIHVYKADLLHAAGVAPFSTLLDFAITSSSAGTYSAPSAQVQVGHLADDTPQPGAWTSTLAAPVVVHASTAGPYAFPYVANAWISLPGFGAAGFVWDGVRDVGVLISTAPGATGGFSARRTDFQPRLGVNVFGAVLQPPTSTGFFALKARLTFSGAPPQPNTPEATLTLNGAGALTVHGGDLLTVVVSSTTLLNQPFLILTSSTISGAHYQFTGQTFDLGNPALNFLDVFAITPGGVVPLTSAQPIGALDGGGQFVYTSTLACGFWSPRTYFQALISDAAPPDFVRITGVASIAMKPGCRRVAAGAFPIAVPDGGPGVVFSVTVPAGSVVADLDVRLGVDHADFGQLHATLTAPGGPTVVLLDGVPADPSDLAGLYRFSDEGASTLDASALASTTTLLPGRYRPDGLLSAFDGLNPAGTWTLTVTDVVPGTQGSVFEASLVFDGAE